MQFAKFSGLIPQAENGWPAKFRTAGFANGLFRPVVHAVIEFAMYGLFHALVWNGVVCQWFWIVLARSGLIWLAVNGFVTDQSGWFHDWPMPNRLLSWLWSWMWVMGSS